MEPSMVLLLALAHVEALSLCTEPTCRCNIGGCCLHCPRMCMKYWQGDKVTRCRGTS